LNSSDHMRVGAIDIGSNSIRMLVADVPEHSSGDAVRVVARAGEACRMARGLGRSGRIDAEIAGRAGTVAKGFAERARGLGAVHIVCGATAALRNAANGIEVAGQIERLCSVPVRILSGDDEARLVYRAVIQGLGSSARRNSCVVFDIGGGSTEVVSGVGELPGRWVSLPFGAVSLTERHLASNPPTPAEVEELRQGVMDILMHECAYMPAQTPLLAGVGGTVSLLAALDLRLKIYEPALLEGLAIGRERLDALIQRILASTHEERRSWPVMGEGRADIVVAGAIVVGMLAERFPSSALVCSTQGLRYGLVRLAADEVRGSRGYKPDATRHES
jgi:exopolyphosphatase / guanosine-5'-triphosphate,3'-diphosphate pyrophosphatase